LLPLANADLAPIYEHVCTELGLQVDAAKLAGMKERNATKLAELEAKIADARENLGETEVRDALLAKAEFLADIGDREGATKAFEAAEAKTAGSGNKMDLVFSQIR
jgi:26S proteasome regulatory subunit N7